MVSVVTIGASVIDNGLHRTLVSNPHTYVSPSSSPRPFFVLIVFVVADRALLLYLGELNHESKTHTQIKTLITKNYHSIVQVFPL
jgi:hypothetical protein